MNKVEIVQEFVGILSLIRELSDRYSKKQVMLSANIDQADKLEQQLDMLSESGFVTTIDRKAKNIFNIGLNNNVLVFYQNHYDKIQYIFDTDLENIDLNKPEHKTRLDQCMRYIRRMFWATEQSNHCENCCMYDGDE